MRTPLNVVMMGLDLLKMDISNNDTNNNSIHDIILSIERIQLSCQHTVDILDELLSYDKIQTGLLSLKRVIEPISSVIDESIYLYAGVAKEYGVKLQLECSLNPNMPTSSSSLDDELDNILVKIDKNRILPVFNHLLSNAIERCKLHTHINNNNTSTNINKNDKEKGKNIIDKCVLLKVSVIPNPNTITERSSSPNPTTGKHILRIDIRDDSLGVQYFENFMKKEDPVIQDVSKKIVQLHQGNLYETINEEYNTITIELPMIEHDSNLDDPDYFTPNIFSTPNKRKKRSLSMIIPKSSKVIPPIPSSPFSIVLSNPSISHLEPSISSSFKSSKNISNSSSLLLSLPSNLTSTALPKLPVPRLNFDSIRHTSMTISNSSSVAISSSLYPSLPGTTFTNTSTSILSLSPKSYITSNSTSTTIPVISSRGTASNFKESKSLPTPAAITALTLQNNYSNSQKGNYNYYTIYDYLFAL